LSQTKKTRPKRQGSISKDKRTARAIELKTQGLTDTQISNAMQNEGYKHVSQRTINRLLNSAEAQNIRAREQREKEGKSLGPDELDLHFPRAGHKNRCC